MTDTIKRPVLTVRKKRSNFITDKSLEGSHCLCNYLLHITAPSVRNESFLSTRLQNHTHTQRVRKYRCKKKKDSFVSASKTNTELLTHCLDLLITLIRCDDRSEVAALCCRCRATQPPAASLIPCSIIRCLQIYVAGSSLRDIYEKKFPSIL